MNKQEFLNQLTERLSNISENEQQKIVEYYNECIDDMLEEGMSEEDAINNLSSVDDIINSIEIELPKMKKGIKANRVEKNYTFKNTFEELNVTDFNTPIYFFESKDDDIHIKVFESEKDEYIIFQDLGEKNSLNVSYENKRGFFESIVDMVTFDFIRNKYVTEIYLPKSNEIKLDINIKSENGGMFINDLSVKSLTIKNTNGKIKVKNVKSQNNIEITNKNGKLSLYEIDCRDLFVQNTNGKLKINEINVQQIDVKNVNGKVEVKDVMSHVMEIKTVNGALELEHIKFLEKADFETGNGHIDLELSGRERDYKYIIKTKNGAIKFDGSFIGNYLSGGSGKEFLNINSKNGAVNVSFKK